ncbi:hypothetical protein ABH966_004873 [Lysinibacillus sp. RC46]
MKEKKEDGMGTMNQETSPFTRLMEVKEAYSIR